MGIPKDLRSYEAETVEAIAPINQYEAETELDYIEELEKELENEGYQLNIK